MPSTQSRGLAAPVLFACIATVVIALAQVATVPAVTSPHLAAATPPSTASTSWSDTVPAGLRTPTTTTTTAPPPTTTSTTAPPVPPPPPRATVPAPRPTPPASAADLPARGQATAWGCDAALAYLRAYAAPGFVLECPGDAQGHEGMTCDDEPGTCPSGGLIAIADPCPQTYMNEASNSWVLMGQSDAPIDPYGHCP